jgi:hypothetical protein
MVKELQKEQHSTKKITLQALTHMKKLFKKSSKLFKIKGTILPGLVNMVNQQFREFYGKNSKKQSYRILFAGCYLLFLIICDINPNNSAT